MNTNAVHLLINAGSRQARQSRRLVKKSLAAHGLTPIQTHIVKRGVNLGVVCRTILSADPDLVIIGGGDGTVSGALHYFANSDIEIGIIPLGTTNNFARSLRIPLTIPEAVSTIKRTKARPVDLGLVAGRHFANVIGIGLSARIAQTVNDASKKRWGRAAYLLAGLRLLSTHKPFIVTIRDKDDELSFNIETHQVIIANGRYHAGKKIAIEAAVDNRELIIFALGGRGWLSFTWHTLDYYLGRRKKIVHGSFAVGKHVTIKTSRKEPYEIDGEISDKTPLQVRVAPAAVKIRHRQ